MSAAVAELASSNCAVCQVPAKQSCSACKLVKYCSAEHQRKHWRQHKTECRPFRIGRDEQLGRYLVATRDISAGSSIFSEAPLIVGPKWYLTERDERVPVMPCVGCYTPCRMGVHVCAKCGWPVCDASCGGLENPNLHGLECGILMLGPGPASTEARALVDYYRSDALVVLKCLLLQRHSPKKWTELMDMQSHEAERLGSDLHNEAERRVVSYLQRNFLQRLQALQQQSKEPPILRECDAKVLHRICGIIETNYMCISVASGLELSGVYYTGCMMEHSCLPNCYFQFDHRNGFKISVVAGGAIRRGDHLKIMYSNMLWGTQLRQEHLTVTKHFRCTCERCADPTECGTHFSSLLCMGDTAETTANGSGGSAVASCAGMQTPKQPLSEKTDWACDRCPVAISGEEVRYLLTQMQDEVDALLARRPTIKQLETLIEKLSKFLHPHHYHMFSLKHSLIQLYGTEAGYAMAQLSAAQLDRKMQMCRDLYVVCEKLDPHAIRLSIYVSVIFYEMHSVLVERGKRLLAASSGANDDGDGGDQIAASTEAQRLFSDAMDQLLRAAKVLEKELDNVAGSKLSDAVLKAIQTLQALMKKSGAAAAAQPQA